jgi:hypothetical protein
MAVKMFVGGGRLNVVISYLLLAIIKSNTYIL